MSAFRDQLVSEGLLHPAGADGIYGRSERFEAIVEALDNAVSRMSVGDGSERLRFPPAIPRETLERTKYMQNFPQLAGAIHCFCGDERAHRQLLQCIETGEDWSQHLSSSELALTAAACYPVYPLMAARGPLPAEGLLADVMSWCFRHEPSLHPTRMQFFRMREKVRLGQAGQIETFRETWMDRALDFAKALGLPAEIDDANDPFFGRAGKVMADSQRNQRLKFELLIPITDETPPVACASFNHHHDHFAAIWGVKDQDGALANTGCVGFGLERLTLALLRWHGLNSDDWPLQVRAQLWP
jgi:seryl-tRNA synthetase